MSIETDRQHRLTRVASRLRDFADSLHNLAREIEAVTSPPTGEVRPVSEVAPLWRQGARRADPAMRDIGYHDRHCARWARAACDAGLCVPKYLWPQWERRQPVDALRGFVGRWATLARGDAAETFWPRAFSQEFGTALGQSRGDKTTRALDAVEEARTLLGHDATRAIGGGPNGSHE